MGDLRSETADLENKHHDQLISVVIRSSISCFPTGHRRRLTNIGQASRHRICVALSSPRLSPRPDAFMGDFFACCVSLPTTRLSFTSGVFLQLWMRPLMLTRKPTVGGGAGSSGACGPPSAWHVLRPLPCPRRFLEKAIRGPEPGAQVFEPLHLTSDLRAPTGCHSPFSLSFFVFLYV